MPVLSLVEDGRFERARARGVAEVAGEMEPWCSVMSRYRAATHLVLGVHQTGINSIPHSHVAKRKGGLSSVAGENLRTDRIPSNPPIGYLAPTARLIAFATAVQAPSLSFHAVTG